MSIGRDIAVGEAVPTHPAKMLGGSNVIAIGLMNRIVIKMTLRHNDIDPITVSAKAYVFGVALKVATDGIDGLLIVVSVGGYGIHLNGLPALFTNAKRFASFGTGRCDHLFLIFVKAKVTRGRTEKNCKKEK